VATLVTPLAVIMFIGIRFILKHAVGEGFISAAEPTRLLIIGAWFSALFFWARPALLAIGKSRTPMVVNFISMLLYLCASLIMIPKYGINGAAGAYCMLMIFGYSVSAFFVYKHVRTSTG
jgi:O-antigen/teichoic acid export membrane protein